MHFTGDTVYSWMADYQSRSNGGDGWMRIMRFSPSTNTISVKTYSPTLNQYETDASSQFSVYYDMSSTTSPFSLIGTDTELQFRQHDYISLQWAFTEYLLPVVCYSE